MPRIPPARAVLALALLLYAAMAIVWMRPMSLAPATVLPDLGDPVHLAYVMAWDAHQLVRRPWALFESNSFYPWPHSLAFGDHLLPEAVQVAPLLWATGNAVLAYNASALLALVLSALAMFLFVRDLTRSAAGGFVAGLAYAFNGFTFTEVARVQVVHLEWWPLALLFLHRFLRRPSRRHAILLATCVAIQGLSGTYYLVYSAIIVPVWLAVAYAAWPRRPAAVEIRALAIAFAIAAIPVASMMWPYVGRLGEAEGTVSRGADLLAFVVPGAANPLFGAGAREASYAREFLGYGGLAAMLGGLVAGLWPRRAAAGTGGENRELDAIAVRAFTVVAATTLVAGLLLTLGTTIHVRGVETMPGPLGLVLKVLPLTSLRQTPRYVALARLGGAVLIGVGVGRLASRLPRPAGIAGVAILSALLPIEQWQPPMYGARLPVGDEVPPVYRWLAKEGTGPVVELPLYGKKRFWALYLYFSTYHWRGVPIGRTSFYPPSHELLATTVSRFPDETSVEVLDRLGVRTVVVDPEVWEPRERTHRLQQLDAIRRLEPVRAFTETSVMPWLTDSRVYRIRPDEGSLRAPCRLEGELPRESWRPASMVAPGVGRMLDGRLDTSWTTGRAQAADDRLRVLFGAPADLSAVVLQGGAAFGEFPRNPVLELQDAAGAWSEAELIDRPLERWRTLDALMKTPVQAPYVFRFARRRATGLRITLASEGTFTAPWTVAELRAFRDCR